jgi:hypothetical protein
MVFLPLSLGCTRASVAFWLATLAPLASGAPAGWIAVDAATLERHRGGFTTPQGLNVSLGIERAISINGELVSRTTLQLANIDQLVLQSSQHSSATLSEVKLIQNGSDNMMLASFSSSALAGTIVQNTLSDQQIETRTVIDASANSVGLLKTINFQGNLSDAIARTVVPR